MPATDATRAIDCGVKGIYVSNHGGRAVDHELSPMEVLAEIVDAVDGRGGGGRRQRLHARRRGV
ncbi:MAG TPA: alpha-hydroxy-acid oxidizing protein [Acidimicrobiia bacterium]|nr:alpha-hydroxy-acid oxidizing protein [Acidimicrobiia bacterium]